MFFNTVLAIRMEGKGNDCRKMDGGMKENKQNWHNSL